MEKSERVIHSMDSKQSSSTGGGMGMVAVIAVFAIVLGGATGFFASKVFGSSTSSSKSSTSSSKSETGNGSTSAGIKDTSIFKDTAEGTLKEGGFEGEGSFHLERPGGDDQNVYLTSSTVDLSQFVGKKVKVLGKTFEAEKAGWLMDVGYIEVK